MLVLRVSLYQYALCNSRTINFRCYWHGEELRIHKLEESFWSPNIEGLIEQERKTGLTEKSLNQLTTYFKKTFGQSDLIVMLPDWHKMETINIQVAMILNTDQILSKIPVFVVGFSNDFVKEYPMIEQEKLFLREMTEQGRFISKFREIFTSHNSIKDDIEIHEATKDIFSAGLNPNFWTPVDNMKDEILVQIIHHALTLELQRMLNLHKCYGGTIDGWFSDRTKQAVRRFQKFHDLPADGQLNRETWKILRQEV